MVGLAQVKPEARLRSVHLLRALVVLVVLLVLLPLPLEPWVL
jgi:hypothetical protein